MSSNTITTRGIKEVPVGVGRTVQATMETVLLTPKGIESWKLPPFQRPLRINPKVQALAEELKSNGGIMPGVITLGVLDRERYLLDGQHRIEAFKISGLTEGLADVRMRHFGDMGEMGVEFVNLNSSLVRMRPDDILRGLEQSNSGLTYIRKHCSYVGYDYVRRGPKSPLLSMSLLLRAWGNSAPEVPTSAASGSVAQTAANLTDDEAKMIVDWIDVCYSAWSRDAENARLWAALNLTLCAWLWRRTVVTQYSPNTVRLTKTLFGKCLMSLSASAHYIDWLLGRQLSDRDRSPAYDRIKTLFVYRLKEEPEFAHRQLIRFPSPAWAHAGGSIKDKRAAVGL